MSSIAVQYESLASRSGFNASVRHIKAVISAVEDVGGKTNLADILDELLADKTIDQDQVLSAVSMILGDRYGYATWTDNLDEVSSDPASIAALTSTWNAVDLVVVYHHPDLGVLALNPKNPAHMAKVERLARHEFLVVYAGCFAKEGDRKLNTEAAKAVCELFAGRKAKDAAFLKGECAWKPAKAAKPEKLPTAKKSAAPKAAPKKAGRPPKAAAAAAQAPVPVAAPPKLIAQGPRPGARMTPMYNVPVTNELFHNGNVEAWKRIIDSYKTKHPDCEVLVYYDNERITNLNALFKWGKVKHGSSIQFAVKGENIADVAKLLRYLQQGASHMFEAFLRGPVNSVLSLF